jgi:glycosyltransferase involved in cell wall biosynthesis
VIRACFLTGDPDSASARVRLRDPLPHLRQAGVEAEVRALPRGTRARWRAVRAVSEFDVVLLHRRLLGPASRILLRSAARALVLDFDDALYTRPFGRPDRRSRRRFAALLDLADLVVVGSGHLQREVLLRARRPVPVRLVPPASPPPRLGDTTVPDDGRVRLVWTGSQATLPYLEDLLPTLRDLARQRPDVLLVVVSNVAPPPVPGLEVQHLPWTLEAEERALREAQVGLYPLRDDPWSLGKCAYKVRRYMAFGLPAVASPHGGGREALGQPVAGHPVAGLLAESPSEWLQALRRLIDEPQLRQRLGTSALARAGEESLERRAGELAAALRDAALSRS